MDSIIYTFYFFVNKNKPFWAKNISYDKGFRMVLNQFDSYSSDSQ